MTTLRHYYRCQHCLELTTTTDRLPESYGQSVAKCGICHGPMEHIGRVQRDRLVTDHEKCVCDDRCTCARGPLCSCSCGGENHGIGLAAGTITYTEDAGRIPILHPATATRTTAARARAAEFTTARAAMRAELHAILDRRAAGWIPRADFDRMRELQAINRKIDTARTHAGRMKTLRAVLTPESETTHA